MNITSPSAEQLQFRFPASLRRLSLALILAGLALAALQFVFPWHPPKIEHSAGAAHHWNPRFFYSVHLALLVALPLALGGIYFSAVHHVSGAVWSTAIRRLAEQFFWYLPLILLLFMVIVLGAKDVFHHWLLPEPDDHLIAWKAPWLDFPFFVIRNILFFVLSFVFAWALWRGSTLQDQDGKNSRSRSLVRISSVFLVFFALSYSMNSWDLSLSLEPHWFSTLWALYIFSGLALTLYAALILWLCYLKAQGYYGDLCNENHLHDLGKYLWAHSIFWAYMAISQYMLIWYAAIPEETSFFKTRLEGPWFYVSFGLALVRFVLPFLLMLKRETKRNYKKMAVIALIVLVGQVWDMYWIAYPVLGAGHFVPFSWQEIGPLAFVIGSHIYIVAWALEKRSLVPQKDPRIEQCLHFHQ